MASSDRTESRTGLLLIALSSIGWGTIPLFVRLIEPMPVTVGGSGVTLNAAPVVIVFWRVAIEAAFLLVYLGVRRRLVDVARLPPRTLVALAANGVLLASHWILFFSALMLTDVAVAELLVYTGPIYVAALTPFVLKEPFDGRVVLPILLALGGIGVILVPHSAGVRSGEDLLGAAMALLAAFLYALLMLNAKRLLRGLPSSTIVFSEASVATLLLLPAVLLLPAPGSGTEWAAVAVLGAFHSLALVFVFMAGLRRVRADHAAVLMYLEPLSAVLFASLLLGEPLGFTTVVGGSLVVLGGVLVTRLTRSPSVEGPFTGLEDAYEPGLADAASPHETAADGRSGGSRPENG